MNAAEQVIDAETAAKLHSAQFGLARRRHDFHPRARARFANGRRQALQHRSVGADILEADMAKTERPGDLDEGERVRQDRKSVV